MARKKVEKVVESEVAVAEPVSFLEVVNGKIPNKDSERLTRLRDRLAALTEEVLHAKCHQYGLKDTVYFRWKQELLDLQSMFDLP